MLQQTHDIRIVIHHRDGTEMSQQVLVTDVGLRFAESEVNKAEERSRIVRLLKIGICLNAARHLLGNHVDAEDAAQEVFLRLHQKLNGFRGRSTFTTWLFRLSVNAIIDYQRRWRRYEAQPDAPEPVADPEAEVLRRIGYRNLLQALAELPPDYRIPLVLRDLYGLTYNEISEAIDRPVGTVKASVHRGRNSLRLRLRACGVIDDEG